MLINNKKNNKKNKNNNNKDYSNLFNQLDNFINEEVKEKEDKDCCDNMNIISCMEHNVCENCGIINDDFCLEENTYNNGTFEKNKLNHTLKTYMTYSNKKNFKSIQYILKCDNYIYKEVEELKLKNRFDNLGLKQYLVFHCFSVYKELYDDYNVITRDNIKNALLLWIIEVVSKQDGTPLSDEDFFKYFKVLNVDINSYNYLIKKLITKLKKCEYEVYLDNLKELPESFLIFKDDIMKKMSMMDFIKTYNKLIKVRYKTTKISIEKKLFYLVIQDDISKKDFCIKYKISMNTFNKIDLGIKSI